MSEKQNNDSKWKDSLLKSSLPLELLVAEKIARTGFDVNSEYSYIRTNEQGIETEFSVDLHASKSFDMPYPEELATHVDLLIPGLLPDIAEFDMLIECKYNYPGVKWVFSPHPDSFLSLNSQKCIYDLDFSRTGYNSVLGDLTLDGVVFNACNRGIELNTNGFDPNSISRGLSQLRYALPNLVVEKMQDSLFGEGRTYFFVFY